MKYLVAIVTAPEADGLCEALLGAGVDAITAVDVRDYRWRRRLRETYKGVEYAVPHRPKVKLEVALAEDMVETALALIGASSPGAAVYVLQADPGHSVHAAQAGFPPIFAAA